MLGPQTIASGRCAPMPYSTNGPGHPFHYSRPPAGHVIRGRRRAVGFGLRRYACRRTVVVAVARRADWRSVLSALEILIIVLAPLMVVLMVCGELPVLSQRALNEPVTAMISPAQICIVGRFQSGRRTHAWRSIWKGPDRTRLPRVRQETPHELPVRRTLRCRQVEQSCVVSNTVKVQNGQFLDQTASGIGPD